MNNRRTSIALTLALALWGTSCDADPLHKYGNEGAWIHADSGWIFPMRVGGFERADRPYTIDGNNDVGVEYERVADGVSMRAIVEVFSAESAAAHAKLETARLVMQEKSGSAEEERPFSIDCRPELEGSRLDYPDSTGFARLYFLSSDRWAVNIRTIDTLEKPQGTKPLDDFVRALPWKTLGADAGFH